MNEKQDVVLLVHGLAAHWLMLKPLENHIRKCGFQTLNWGYASIWSNISQHAVRLAAVIRQLHLDPGVGSIQLVTHSMGGIVARAALLECEIGKIKSMLMLAPPNKGSRVAAVLSHGLRWICKPLPELSDSPQSFVNTLPPPPQLQIGIIAAEYDRVVALESTHLARELPREVEHQTVPTGHNSMLFRRDVAESVTTFLKTGHFQKCAPFRESLLAG
jgi:pimeloyl-ACP methyl ester carboxylesterase